ncbi:chemotaxis protein CheC [Curvibacter sp. APW13]|uniref:chemotaxis protein CheC n=1 Tax=Curvibacter sp. APW13 TaxID=3077236 RepID=UPI0028DF1428|nr:chemotaxis protein CheC [Curvibacter sp. APW13]MDT8991115.1 chemotaxis protein CheC [Curvibacter sp. APW13]
MRLSELEIDALGEIFNVGVGLAADVMSQMVNETVRLSVPIVEVVSHDQAGLYFVERIKRPLCAIRQTYVGEVTTDAILMFPEDNSLELVRAMVGSDVPVEQLADMERDAMAEIGNIILNAVISSISNTLNLSFDGSLPDVSIIDAQGIFTDLVGRSKAGGAPSSVLALTIDFALETRQVNGYLAFLLDIPSSERLVVQLARYIESI